MMIFFGSRLYGKVDEIPHLCHVATKFAHVQFIPLIPVGSYVVFPQRDGTEVGLRIPLRGKSILAAWVRVFFLIALVIAAIFTSFAAIEKDITNTILSGVITVVCLAALIGSIKWAPIAVASYERALRLADQAGFSPEQRLAIEIVYGKMNADQATRELSKWEEERATVSA